MDINDIRKEIIESFNEFLHSKNKKLIKKYSKKRLLTVLDIMESYSDQQWYKEIEKRVEEINKWQEKLWNWLMDAAISIFVALAIVYLKGCLN